MKHAGFNPKARWDRHVPAQEAPEAPEPEREEVIEVLALFRAGEAHPQSFSWNGKTYPISRTTYHWKEHRGSALISYFTVSTGCDLYQISFNNSTFGWRLEKILS
jgi:hypothetical protein